MECNKSLKSFQGIKNSNIYFVRYVIVTASYGKGPNVTLLFFLMASGFFSSFIIVKKLITTKTKIIVIASYYLLIYTS